VSYELIAAVDLGSNSFRLQVGRIVGNQIYPLDSLKDPVRLAAGLDAERLLDEASRLRALEALSRFGERLRGFVPGAVRAVATNTFRVARNVQPFLQQCEAALGFPIEVVAGREEARLIYLGVAHTLQASTARQLVIDIGGGSTEFIIGQSFTPLQLESLYMGCVSHTLKFFSGGNFERQSLKAAELAARKELQTIVAAYREMGWDQVIGSSGTAKAIADLLHLNGLNDPVEGTGQEITRGGLERLKGLLLRAGNINHLRLEGLRPDRCAVLPGGLAIMSAIFSEFGLERMEFSEGALRLGVLYDLLGRYHHDDLREATVNLFMQRYAVDRRQAARVSQTALVLLRQLVADNDERLEGLVQVLTWAARLHEIGISVAHSGYHKHSAYVIAHADMPGFSRMDQGRLSNIVLGHRGKLDRLQSLTRDPGDWLLIFCLRLAALLHRARDDIRLSYIGAEFIRDGYRLTVDADWLSASPLTASILDEEIHQWSALGMALEVRREKQAKTPWIVASSR
jgi:exopolyphosphatase/guanosine-5'-triphosphate,3'-diphosphate pyrophosphatase